MQGIQNGSIKIIASVNGRICSKEDLSRAVAKLSSLVLASCLFSTCSFPHDVPTLNPTLRDIGFLENPNREQLERKY